MWLHLLIILFSLFTAAFFSGIIIAFFQLQTNFPQSDNHKKSIFNWLKTFFLFRSSSLISTCLTANTISLVIYGFTCFHFFRMYLLPGSSLMNPLYLVLFFGYILLIALLYIVLSEFFLKVPFIVNPGKSISVSVIPLLLVFIILMPLTIPVRKLIDIILRFKGIRINQSKYPYEFYDLLNSVLEGDLDTHPDTGADVDTQILRNAIDLPNIRIREFMIPRPEIKAVEINESIGNLKKMFVETGHSRIVVYDDHIDQIVGYVHVIDLFDQPRNIKNMVKQMLIFSEAMPANQLLKEFKDSKTNIGLVVDEFGGTAGIVTLEDVLEEIFGEIKDEYDKDDLKEVIVNETEYIFSARLEIDYLNDKYGFRLPTGDYETLGGYILDIHQSIPSKNTVIETDHYKFLIISSSDNRIQEIHLKVKSAII